MEKRLALLVVLGFLLFAGCGDPGGTLPAKPKSGGTSITSKVWGWVGAPFKSGAEWVKTAIDWLAPTDKIEFTSTNIRKDGNAWTSDVKLTVTHNDATWNTTMKDIACNEDGIPTDDGMAKVKTEVEALKNRIKEIETQLKK